MREVLTTIVNRNPVPMEHCVDKEKLNRYTKKISYSEVEKIGWGNIEHLYVVGFDQPREVELRRDDEPRPGCYVNPDRTWLLMYGECLTRIQWVISQCGSELRLLNVGFLDFEEIDVSHLVGLRWLDLSQNEKLCRVHGLSNLKQLEALHLYHTSIGPAIDVSVLDQLIELNVWGNRRLSRVDGLSHCRQLRTLSLAETSVGPQLDVSALEKLEKLILREANSLNTIKGLESICELKTLCLRGTELKQIPDGVRNMRALVQLDLSELELDELPDWLTELGLEFSLEWKKAGIILEDTRVDGVDMSIFSQSQEVILDWFKSQKEGRPLNEIKVVFLGDGSTGKSLTVARLLKDGAVLDDFDGEATPGIAIEDRNYELSDGRKVQVHFWDFGGQEILHSMHRIFLTDRTLYVVMINARNNTQDDQARYWLHNVSSFAAGCPVLLVLNQVDQNPNASINERSLKRLYPDLRQVIRLSALNFDQETFNQEFTEKMLKQISAFKSLGTIFPPSWKKVMDQLRGMEGNYIRGGEFARICQNSGVDGQKLRLDLLKWFHDIGVSFCCGQSARLRDYVVLRPEWITNAIYTIIWNKRSETTNGMVDRDEIYELLSPEARDEVKRVRADMCYGIDDVDYVLNITRQFRLSFPMDDGKEFIPILCDANALPEADDFLAEPGIIEFRMEYDYLPSNVLHRLMVEMRQDLIPDKVWLTGALLRQKYNHIEALVKSEGDVLSIYIKAGDADHKAHTYLNTLRCALDAIHQDMGLKPPKMLVAYTEDDQTEYFPYKMLEGARQMDS